jgi:hypothetical protein
MWGRTTSKNRASASSVTSTRPGYYARIILAWTLSLTESFAYLMAHPEGGLSISEDIRLWWGPQNGEPKREFKAGVHYTVTKSADGLTISGMNMVVPDFLSLDGHLIDWSRNPTPEFGGRSRVRTLDLIFPSRS